MAGMGPRAVAALESHAAARPRPGARTPRSGCNVLCLGPVECAWQLDDNGLETVIGVARKMESFRYDPSVCSFKGWLMHVTRCRIADQFRRRRPQNVPLAAPRADTTAETTLNLHDPAADVLEGIWNEEWQKNLVDVAMDRVRRQANPEHYQIFHLHAVKGLGVRDVAKLTGASLPKVYVTYHRIAKLVKAEVRRLETTNSHA